jgi:hypothetical protein
MFESDNFENEDIPEGLSKIVDKFKNKAQFF